MKAFSRYSSPLASLVFTLFLLVSCAFPSSKTATLKVFVHDTFGSADSHEFNALMQEFEEREDIKIEWITYGNAPLSLLNKMEDPSFEIDLLYGIDNTTLIDFKKSNLFYPYASQSAVIIHPELDLDTDHFFTPINYGWLAFEYSTKNWDKALPQTLADLVQDPWKGQYILSNPRTSDIGLLFALWLDAAGYPVETMLTDLKRKAFSIAPSWGSAYTLYVSGEAPFVLTYSSSPAYHAFIEEDKTQRTVLDTENSYLHVEFMGIAKQTRDITLSQRFLDYMLSEAVQATLPRRVWTFPARMGTPLPPEFVGFKPPTRLLSHTPEQIQELKDKWFSTTWF